MLQEFADKTAVITGAASGIGRALALRCASEGMRLALADIDEQRLERVSDELKARGVKVLHAVLDVSCAADVESFSDLVFERLGGVHLLFNNAGVANPVSLLHGPRGELERVVGVNLWGVVHGVRAFVPRMHAQNVPCHVVNTASMSGFIAGPAMAIYKMTKHAVVSLSETLEADLALARSPVGVSVLSPGFVRTDIFGSGSIDPAAGGSQLLQQLRTAIDAGMDPAEVARLTFAGIVRGDFYLFTDNQFAADLHTRSDRILGAMLAHPKKSRAPGAA